MKAINCCSLVAALVLAAGSSAVLAGESKVTLSGTEEVPAVTTTASGTGTITVSADKKVSGSIKTSGIDAVAAHIHVGADGKEWSGGDSTHQDR